MAPSLGLYRQPSLTSDPIEVDPSNPGTILRVALGLESIINLPFAGWALFYPASFLGLLASNPSQITPVAEMASRYYGVTVLGMTAPMVFGVFNNRGAIESRPYSYLMLAGAEAGMLSTALWVIYGPGAASGFAPDAAWSLLKQIGPAFLWRLFVFLKKPQWFGRYKEAKRSL
ncbi:uncharacterized protein BDZ99DRAFT_517493 [Mytilinidion resinicola]|uniref:Uncharacterized protein n=1 Tax=Mytilinidion resinicola TaxID=574789 RepID=A0A6A6YWM8_9PEZI|nr:uncharacterized protein BDZ99DRAFT_517493 [Mytilinidion resinicola]KAF2813211.1 hypothetical protein BDZ99DRAFT_517493 [Mytilinidion resinicola]